MKDNIELTRRGAIQSVTITGLAGLGGCLRLTGSSDEDASPASNTNEEYATLYSFDTSTGSVRWSHDTSGNGLETRFQSVERIDNSVYYAAHGSGSGDDQRPIVRSLNATNGETEWEYGLGEDFISGMIAQEESIFIFKGGEVFELDSSSGEEVQRKELLFPSFNGIATKDGIVYILGYEEGIRAFDIVAGETIWQNPEVTKDSNATPLIAENTLYYGTEGGYLLAVDLESGSKKWEARVDGAIERQPRVSNNHTWIVDSLSNIYGLRKTDGNEEYNISSGIASSGWRLAAANDTVAFKGDTRDRETVAYQITESSDFQELWTNEKTLKSYSRMDEFVLGRQQLQTYNTAGEETGSTDEVTGIARLNNGKAVDWEENQIYAGFVRPDSS